MPTGYPASASRRALAVGYHFRQAYYLLHGQRQLQGGLVVRIKRSHCTWAEFERAASVRFPSYARTAGGNGFPSHLILVF